MTTPGKARLDNRGDDGRESRPQRYAEIERRAGEAPGAKEMAMTRRPREEDASQRAERFLDMERRGES